MMTIKQARRIIEQSGSTYTITSSRVAQWAQDLANNPQAALSKTERALLKAQVRDFIEP
jgi:hypothetical protein